MNKVSDILMRKGNDIVSVPPTTSVYQALKIMSERNMGSVIIAEDEKYLGIVTERDYSRKVILKGKNSEATKVSDIMSTDFPQIEPGTTIEYCMGLMTDNKIRYLPVFEGKVLVGIISISDVVKQTIILQQQTIEHLKSYINS